MKKKILIFLFACFSSGFSFAGTIQKSGFGSLSVSGSVAKYSNSPGGSIVSPNSGYSVKSTSPLGALLEKPLTSTELISGVGLFEELLRKPVKVQTLVSPKSLAKGLVNPWTFTASVALQPVLSYLEDQACIRIAGGQMVNTGGLWEECQIINTVQKPTLQWLWKDPPQTFASTSNEACALKLPASYNPNNGWGNGVGYSIHFSETVAACWAYQYNTSNPSVNGDVQFSQVSAEWRCPDGSVPPNGDKNADCALSETKKWNPTDPIAAMSKVEQALVNNPNFQASVFNDLFNNNIPLTDVESSTISGPTAVQSTNPVVTTTTNPDGSVVTKTETKTYNYQYSGDTINHISTTTTNITNNNSTNETTTETKNEPTEQQENFCKQNPSSLMCKDFEFDTPDEDIPRSTFDLTYQEESFLDGGSCPADVFVNVGGHSVKAADWQSHCSNISRFVRPLVILLSTFVALLILVPGGREVAS